MLAFLVLSLLISSARAEEPAAPTTPTATTANADTGRVNRRGIRNNPPVVVGFDVNTGCLLVYTIDGQYMDAETLATIVDAGTNARTQCVTAAAEAQEIEDRAEAELLRAKGDRGAMLLLASAGADAVRTAADNGQPTYTNGRDLVSATGGAAFVAAAGSGGVGGVAPLGNYAYNQAAWDLTRPPPPVQIAPPPAPAPTQPAAVPARKPATVEDAEARERAATAAAAAVGS